jgi:hypothetical protein
MSSNRNLPRPVSRVAMRQEKQCRVEELGKGPHLKGETTISSIASLGCITAPAFFVGDDDAFHPEFQSC